jgi:hypothetical protein
MPTLCAFFIIYKIREWEWNRFCLGTSAGEDKRKRCGRVNMVQILHTHVFKWKMIPVETIPGMGGRE